MITKLILTILAALAGGNSATLDCGAPDHAGTLQFNLRITDTRHRELMDVTVQIPVPADATGEDKAEAVASAVEARLHGHDLEERVETGAVGSVAVISGDESIGGVRVRSLRDGTDQDIDYAEMGGAGTQASAGGSPGAAQATQDVGLVLQVHGDPAGVDAEGCPSRLLVRLGAAPEVQVPLYRESAASAAGRLAAALRAQGWLVWQQGAEVAVQNPLAASLRSWSYGLHDARADGGWEQWEKR